MTANCRSVEPEYHPDAQHVDIVAVGLIFPELALQPDLRRDVILRADAVSHLVLAVGGAAGLRFDTGDAELAVERKLRRHFDGADADQLNRGRAHLGSENRD